MIRNILSFTRPRIAAPACVLALSIAAAYAADHKIPHPELLQPFEWTYGCTPTSGSMVLSYWDNEEGMTKFVGYGKLLKYYLNAPCSFKNVPNTVRELKHEMSTDYDVNQCSGDGSTSPWNIDDGVKTVTNTANGYSFVSQNICEATWPQIIGDWCWGDIKSEIDAHRPFIWSVGHAENPISYPGHSMAAWGYTDDKYVIVYSTWDVAEQHYYYSHFPRTSDGLLSSQVNQISPAGALEDDITLDDPIGDETLTAGSTYRIHWYQWGTTISTVAIDFSADRGNNWTAIATVPSARGRGWYSYDWQVPNTPIDGRGRIRVSAYHANGGLIAGDGSFGNFTIQPPCADLVTQSITTNPASPMAGQTVDVTVTVKNQGTCTATPSPKGSFIDVAFYKDRTSAPGPTDWGDIEDGLVANNAALEIPAGGTATLTGRVTYGYTGVFNMWAQVDSRRNIAETNETNNVLGPQTITVVSDDRPTGSILINGGAYYTNNPNVTLTLTCTDLGSGCDTMQFLQDCGAGNWTLPEPFATTKAWTWQCPLPLYVRFYDKNYNYAQYRAEISLDTSPPTGSIAINGGAASTVNPSVKLSLACTDSAPAPWMPSHCSAFRLSNDNATWNLWQVLTGYGSPVTASPQWTLSSGVGTKSVYVQYRDDAGNRSGSYSASILLKAASSGDLDLDGDIDQNDVNILLSYRGQPASACPKCDLDNDGMITALDARKIVLLCTKPYCAP